MIVRSVRRKRGRREGGLIRRIRKVLRFQAKCVAGSIYSLALAGTAFCQKVCGIELNAGLRRMHLHGDTGFGRGCDGCGADCIGGAVDHIVVVIAMSQQKLRKCIVDVVADTDWLAEIHRSSFYGLNDTDGNAFRIIGGVILREELNCMVQHGAAVMPAEVKIAVVGQIARGFCVSFGMVVDR